MKTKIKICACPLMMIGMLFMLTGCCKKDSPAPVVLKVGEHYKGGIICYLDATGKHGLMASFSDLSHMISWWNGSFVETNSNSTTDGAANTTAIITAQGDTGSYAAKLCRDYRGGGFNDWFLPAKDQLNILYTQKAAIGGFVDEIYWSSTGGFDSAWIQYFLNGQQWIDNTSDGATVCVRAMRAF